MIQRIPEAEYALYNVLRESFVQTERTGIHLTSCLEPRLHYWKTQKPLPPTDRMIGYFVAGRGHEDALAKLIQNDFYEEPEEEIEGIWLRPDFRAISNRVIPAGEYAEFKTRRSNLPKTDEEAAAALASYREQVRGYMALKNRPTMYIIVLSLLEGKDRKDPLSQSSPVFAVYKETATPDELAEIKKDLLARRDLLLAAHTMDDLAALRVPPATPEGRIVDFMPLCTAWKCVRKVKMPTGWETVPACQWYDDCQPGKTDPARMLG